MGGDGKVVVMMAREGGGRGMGLLEEGSSRVELFINACTTGVN